MTAPSTAPVEALLDRRGFAGTPVDELREAAGVSLRTLYRRYGSRAGLVAGALQARADRYLDHLSGAAGVQPLFERAASWLGTTEARGCLLLRARAEHPTDDQVERVVAAYHAGLRDRIATAARADGLPDATHDQLFVLHEGMVAAAATTGVGAAVAATSAAVAALLAR